MNNSLGSQAAALENALAPLFAKLPHLPHNVRQTLVSIAPWLALIFGVLGLFTVLSALAMIPVLLSMPFGAAAMGGSYLPIFIGLILGAVAAVLDLLAWKPLTAHKKKGWNLLYYGNILSVVSSVINMAFGYSGFGGLIGALIGFWLLFEVRSLYTA